MKLGASLLAVDDVRAASAYERECAADGAKRHPLGLQGDCLAVRRELIKRASAHRTACRQKDPAGCERLARLLYYVDVVRAPGVLTEEANLRGPEIHPGGTTGFVIDGIRRFKNQVPTTSIAATGSNEALREAAEFGIVRALNGRPDERPASPDELTAIPPIDPPADSVSAWPDVQLRLGAVSVSGDLDRAELDAAVQHKLDRIRTCYRAGLARDPNLQGRVSVRFVIDRSGHVWNVQNGGSDLPDSDVVACVFRVFYSLEVRPPSAGLATVIVPIMLSPPAPSKR